MLLASDWHKRKHCGCCGIKMQLEMTSWVHCDLLLLLIYSCIMQNSICKSCGVIEPSAFDFSLSFLWLNTPSLVFYSPLLKKESFCPTTFSFSFSTSCFWSKVLSSLSLSAMWMLCGWRSICMCIYTHSDIQKRSRDGARTSAHFCPGLSGCLWYSPRQVFQRVLSTA